MRKHLAPIIAAVIVALVVGTFAIAGPGIGITKTAPLAGDGSSGAPLKITVCANGEVYQSNGTSWVCTAAASGGTGTVTNIATTSPITGGPITTTGTIGLSMTGASCSAGQVMTALGATGTGTCTAIGTAGGTTGTGTANTVAKWTGTTALGNSAVTDDGTTWSLNTNKVQMTEASGNTAIAGTLNVVGALSENSARVFSVAGTGLSSSTKTVTLNMAGASCSAGSFVSAITATGGTTCTAEPGDITDVVAGTNMNGGGTSGSVTLNLNNTVSLAGSGSTTTLEALNAATGQTATSLKLVDARASGVWLNGDHNPHALYGGRFDASMTCGGVCDGGTTHYGVYGNATGGNIANYSGYFDNGLFQVNGAASFASTLGATGLLTATAGVTTPANLTTTGSGALVVAGTGSIGSTFTVTGTLNANGDSNIGSTTSAATTFSNGPVGVNTYNGKHLEWADEWMGINNNAGIFAQSTGDISGPVGSMYQVQWNSTGAFLQDETGVTARPGILGLSTGAQTTGGVSVQTSSNAVDFGSGSWTYEIVVGWPVLSVVAQEFWSVFGFIDTNGINQVDGCYFAYDRLNTATAGPNSGNVDALECWCASNSVRTKYLINASGNSDESFALGTGTIAALSYPNTNIYRLKIVMTGTTRAEFYRNNTKVCDINTNLPSGSSRLTGAGIVHNKSAGTTGRLMDVDYTRVAVDLTSARSP